MLGEKLKEARRSRELSLQQVAGKADISAATLSRIENNKQALDLGLFVNLAGILGRDPRDLLVATDESVSQVEPVIRKLAGLGSSDRKALWNQLADSVRETRKGRRSEMRNLAGEVEELLAQLDYLRAEIESVRRRLARD